MKKFFLCFLISIFSVYMSAISSNTAITGKITGTDGKAIFGVKITASSIKKTKKTIIFSNKKGVYRFLGLVPGSYMITYQLEGYKTIIYTNILVNRIKKVRLPIIMKLKKHNETSIMKDQLTLIEVKKISPYSEGLLNIKQKVFVWLSYRIPDNIKEGVLIWVIPDSNKHAAVQFSPLIKSKTGTISRYFAIKKNNIKIKEIWVRMMSKKKDILYQENIKVNLTTHHKSDQGLLKSKKAKKLR